MTAAALRFVSIVCVGCGRIGFDVASPDALPQAPVFVQANATTVTTGTLTSPVTRGDLLIAAIDYGTSATTVAGVSDSLGNVYQLVGPYDGSGFRQYIAYAVTGASGMDTMTVTGPGLINLELRMHEYTSVSAAQPFDAAASTSGSTTTSDGARSPAITTTAANELVFGVIIDGAVTAGTGFAMRSNDFGDVTEDQIASTPGSYEAIATASSQWIATVAAFRGQ